MEAVVNSSPELEVLRTKLRPDILQTFNVKLARFLAETSPNSHEWRPLKIEGHFRSFMKKDKGYLSIKAEHLLPHPIEKIQSVLASYDHRLKYDKVINDCKLVKLVNEATEITRVNVPGQMFVSAREFLTYRIHSWLGADIHLELHYSATDTGIPVAKGAVRGVVDLQALLLRREGENTRAYFYSRASPEISMVPQSILESKGQESVNMLLWLTDYMSKQM